MHTLVVFNARSGSSHRAAAVEDALRHRRDHHFARPAPGELPAALAGALDRGCRRVLAAGGDGTVHAVVNALGGRLADVTLGVVPLGTGNDLARTLALPLDPQAALDALDRGDERRIDLIDVEAGGTRVACVNVAAGGFSGRAGPAASAESKATWGPLAYVIGAARALAGPAAYRVGLTLDGLDAGRHEALAVVVANGRYAAGGWAVASPADPEDGLLDVVVVPAWPVFEMAGVAADLVAGDYLDSGLVEHRRAARVTVASDPPMPFSVDGEPVAGPAVTFAARPRALRVLVGPDYAPRA